MSKYRFRRGAAATVAAVAVAVPVVAANAGADYKAVSWATEHMAELSDCPPGLGGLQPGDKLSDFKEVLATRRYDDVTISIVVNSARQPALLVEGKGVLDIGVRGCSSQTRSHVRGAERSLTPFSVGDNSSHTVRVDTAHGIYYGAFSMELTGAGASEGVVSTARFDAMRKQATIARNPVSAVRGPQF